MIHRRSLLIVLYFIASISFSFGQYCTNDDRFSNAPVFNITSIDSVKDVVYGNAINFYSQSENLTLNVYMPAVESDTALVRPFILLIHGGGFMSGDKEEFNFECREFAKRGFVTATISYRYGFDCQVDTASYTKTVYMAVQDARAALRYMVKKAPEYKIDTSAIFIGGYSAGAVTSLALAYISQVEWNSLNPTLIQTLGDLNSSGNNETSNYSIKGIYNNWGAIVKSFVQKEEMLPMISFHGDKDFLVPVDSALIGSCVNPPLLYGSRALHKMLNNAGVCSDLTIKPEGGHGVYIFKQEEFIFRVGRAACFFKSLFCNNCSGFYSTSRVDAKCAVNSVGIDELNEENKIALFPNPVQSQLNIKGLEGSGAFEINIYNHLGQLFLKSFNTTLDVSSLDTGIYLIKIQQGAKIIYKQFTKITAQP